MYIQDNEVHSLRRKNIPSVPPLPPALGVVAGPMGNVGVVPPGVGPPGVVAVPVPAGGVVTGAVGTALGSPGPLLPRRSAMWSL